MKYDVVVIGSGLGGLSSALKLAKSGKKVAIIEKHFVAGGYATNFTRKGPSGETYVFDVSLHGIGGLTEGAQLHTYLSDMGVLSQITPLRKSECATLLSDTQELDIPDSFIAYKTFLQCQYPNELANLDSLFDFLEIFKQDMDSSIASNKPPTYYQELQSISLYDFLSRYTNDEALIETFSFLWLYYGLPPKKLNALYYLLAWISYHMSGTFYIKGGAGALSQAFVSLFKEAGGEILLSHEVVDIKISHDQVTQVITHKGLTLEADTFILNGDPLHLLSLIKEESTLVSDYKASLTALEVGTSLTQVYIGLDCKCQDIGITKGDYFIGETSSKASWEAIQGRDYHTMNFGLTNYDVLDPHFNEHHGVLCLVIGDHIDHWPARGSETYKTQKHTISTILIERASIHFPELKDHIQVIEVGTPHTMKRYTNNSLGAVYGWAQSTTQGGFDRLSNHSPLSNLYLAGAWTTPGGGFEGAIISGVMCSERILRKDAFNHTQYPHVSGTTNHPSSTMPLNAFMAGMIANFNPSESKGLTATYQFIFDKKETYFIHVENSKVKLLKSPPVKADVIIHVPYAIWYDISFHHLSGEDALMDGKFKVEGDMNVFMQIPLLFSTIASPTTNEVTPKKCFNGTIYLTLTLIPWILYWSLHEYLSPTYLMTIGITFTLGMMFFIKPKSFKEVTKLEGITLFAFLLYGSLDNMSPNLYTHIKYFMMDGLLISTWGLSVFAKTSITGEYSKYAYPEAMSCTKLFIKINKHITLMWTLIFILQFVITLCIPKPISYMAYSLPLIGLLISHFYPKHILGS